MDVITREAWSFNGSLSLLFNSLEYKDKEYLESNSHPKYFGRIGKLVCCTKSHIGELYNDIDNIVCITNSCDNGIYNNGRGIGFKGENDRYYNKTLSDIPNNIYKWFSSNLNITHPKTEALPIGTFHVQHEYLLDNISINQFCKKNKLLYNRFALHTNYKRAYIYNYFTKYNWCTSSDIEINRTDYYKTIQEHNFCISPPGNGIDCYRTWECLYLGTIPIVLKSPFYSYFEDLPILQVDDYNICNEVFLIEQLDLFRNKQFNFEKLDLNYWINRFRTYI